MATVKPTLVARKKPAQKRSTVTVDAIFEATVQVLLQGGKERLTTTKVAERAGVSVGTLYQYFPNKQALLAAILERHLEQVVQAVERVGAQHRSRPLDEAVSAIVQAFIDAKMARPDVSKALYSVAADVGGADIVARKSMRAQAMLCELMTTSDQVQIDDAPMVSLVVLGAVVGPLQALLEVDAPPFVVEQVRAHLSQLALAYLRSVSRQRGAVEASSGLSPETC